MLPGGKGINVSTVLANLGIENTALGFTAGFTGAEIQRRVEKLGFCCDFIEAEEGFSRINVKLKDFDGTEINGKGPGICREDMEQFLEKLEKLKAGDVLVLAGSIPESLPNSIYRDIMARLQGKGIHFAVDATGELLLNVLQYRPFLIKPNNHELGEILKPLVREIYLFNSYVAGTTHLEDQSVLGEIKEEDDLLLQREDNRFDQNAILVLTNERRKLGYIPKKDNVVFARLMDAGKLLKAKITTIEHRGDFTEIGIGIYLVDF